MSLASDYYWDDFTEADRYLGSYGPIYRLSECVT